jgi:hypothetical protein
MIPERMSASGLPERNDDIFENFQSRRIVFRKSYLQLFRSDVDSLARMETGASFRIPSDDFDQVL